jgi:hypothetical protein
MKAYCSFNYFRRTLTKALNYFCQKQKYENKNENLNAMINENDENISVQQLVDAIDKSYTLFIERFPKKILHLQQEDIRKYYKQTFDKIQNPLPEPILKLNESNRFQSLQESNNDDNDQIEDNQVVEQNAIFVDHTIDDEKIVPSCEEGKMIQETFDNQCYQENPILFKTLSKDLNENQKELLHKEYDQQGNRIFLFQ